MDPEGESIDIITSSPGKIKLEHKRVLEGIGIQVPSERYSKQIKIMESYKGEIKDC